MQIHELNNYGGALDSGAYLAVDNGNDTGKVPAETLVAGVKNEINELDTFLNGRIDNIIAGGPAPSEAEIIDARYGDNGVTYPSLGDAIRGQVSDLKNDLYNGVAVHFQPANDFYGKSVTFDYTKMPLLEGYMKGDGTISGTTHKHFILNAYGIKKVTMTVQNTVVSTPALISRDEDDTLITVIAMSPAGTKSYNVPSGFEGELIFNYFVGGTYVDSCTIEYYSRDEMLDSSEVKYGHCVGKPYTFSGKKLHFYGDSITYGYIVGGTQATNPYPETFCNAVGATCSNRGVSGSGFTSASAGTVLEKLQSYGNLNIADTLFVAAGVNDWQGGATSAEVEAGVEAVCQHLQNNYTNGDVIFITPINEAGRTPNSPPKQSLQSVRNIITRTALKYGYSVVQGWDFPFPNHLDTQSFKMLMFQDNLHPTELGYKTYAKCLQTILC